MTLYLTLLTDPLPDAAHIKHTRIYFIFTVHDYNTQVKLQISHWKIFMQHVRYPNWCIDFTVDYSLRRHSTPKLNYTLSIATFPYILHSTEIELNKTLHYKTYYTQVELYIKHGNIHWDVESRFVDDIFTRPPVFSW